MISVISESFLDPGNSNKVSSQKSIFVCTFCQVFSSSVASVANHINSNHKDLLLHGTTAEDYVSQLKALPGGNEEKSSKPLGRPRKSHSESQPQPIEEKKIIEPVQGPDGLYWCETCQRHFKKPRQLVQHRCYINEEDESDHHESSEEFKLNMNIDITPWRRLPKRSRKDKHQNQPFDGNEVQNMIDQENVHLEKTTEQIPPKKKEPPHLRLFNDEKEKLDFENHLKSIDYSFVDYLFTKEKKNPGRNKIENQSCGSVYICSVCKKTQPSITHIRMHCLTHTDVKPFTCPKCPHETNSLGSLYTHMRKHTGNVFSCSKCSFKTTRRAHLRDHEDTHSSIAVMCKLCKNSYKNVRSLIAHVKNYHKNPGGKKYLKLLRSKDSLEVSLSCQNPTNTLMSQSSFVKPIQSRVCKTNSLSQGNNERVNYHEDLKLEETLSMPSLQASNQDNQKALPIKDPLEDIILQTIFEQKNSESIDLYDDVFKETQTELLSVSQKTFSSCITISSKNENSNSQFNPTETVLEECTKTLEIIGGCMSSSKYASNVNQTCIQPSSTPECSQTFHMNKPLSFSSDSNIQKTDKNISELSAESELGDSYPAENKLFEKCHRAPAYVCCVCSGIYICPSTLKAHLREHINTTESFIERAAKDFEEMVEDPNLDVILEDQPDVCIPADEKELEKLYTSSLDMMWYLPEVSVVLDNDPALFDSILEDFPDRLDETEMLEQVQ